MTHKLPIRSRTDSIPGHGRQFIADWCLIALFAGLVYAPMLNLAFWGDDTFLMKMAAGHSAFELLFRGPARAVSQNNFMPLLGVTFFIDRLLFGLNFLGRNLHSLFWLAAAGGLAYQLFRRLGLHRRPALAGGITLVVSPAMVSVAGHYSNRHYLFGFAFALLSLLLVLEWKENGRWGWLWSSVCFYFLALCSKEVFAPLPVVAIHLLQPWQTRSRKAVMGFSAAFLLYLVLRWIMLGHLIGGYTRSVEWGTMAGYLIQSLPRLLQTVVWGGAAPGQISWIAVTCGTSVLAAVYILAAGSHGLRGVFYQTVLLGLSLCVVALALYAPQIRYAHDPFYCHGDRLALPFSAAIWLSFWYLAGNVLATKKNSPMVTGLLAVLIIGPLMYYGGLKATDGWKKTKATIDQAVYLNTHASQQCLVIGDPTWFLGHYAVVLKTVNPDTRLEVMDRPGHVQAYRPQENLPAIWLQPGAGVCTSRDPDQVRQWLKAFTSDYCRLFPQRCP